MFDDQRFDQLRYRDAAFAAAPSGAADAAMHSDGFIVDGARFITFSNIRFSILVFEYSFWKPCSNIFEYSNNRFSTALFVPPLSNGTSRATSDRKPKTNDQILPSPILFFPDDRKTESN